MARGPDGRGVHPELLALVLDKQEDLLGAVNTMMDIVKAARQYRAEMEFTGGGSGGCSGRRRDTRHHSDATLRRQLQESEYRHQQEEAERERVFQWIASAARSSNGVDFNELAMDTVDRARVLQHAGSRRGSGSAQPLEGPVYREQPAEGTRSSNIRATDSGWL